MIFDYFIYLKMAVSAWNAIPFSWKDHMIIRRLIILFQTECDFKHYINKIIIYWLILWATVHLQLKKYFHVCSTCSCTWLVYCTEYWFSRFQNFLLDKRSNSDIIEQSSIFLFIRRYFTVQNNQLMYQKRLKVVTLIYYNFMSENCSKFVIYKLHGYFAIICVYM